MKNLKVLLETCPEGVRRTPLKGTYETLRGVALS